ncbi:MAG: hypothetical protein JO241_01485 [Candidatus Eremiobacteraeota bacterium]|nr:hypothetical protein [Candidatus Eremiobacteraeota bacterium]MBV8582640.1 hypothetical protein [Candidatus Eremiobacteraeota bacterium]
MESAPGCWRIYGEVLAREYGDPAYYAHHSLSVDAYAVQHPGRPSRQTIRSVALHLARLYAILECNVPADRANDCMKRFAESDPSALHWLEPPANCGDITVVDAAAAAGAAAHAAIVREWAQSAWDAWSPHHAQIRAWAEAFVRKLHLQ